MTWMKWRATYREGPSNTWEWFDLGCSGEEAEKTAKEYRIELRDDHAMRYEDGFRTIEYELVDLPPRDVLLDLLKKAEADVVVAERWAKYLRKLLDQ